MYIMNKYLTLKKVLVDCVALCKSHFLYIFGLIGSVLAIYILFVKIDNLPTIAIVFVPIFLLFVLIIEFVSTDFASTGYIDKEFIILNEIKKSLKFMLPYCFLTIISFLFTLLGVSVFIVTSFVVNMFFNLIKVDYIINKKSIKSSFLNITNYLKKGNFFKILKIQLLPILLQFIFAFILSPYLTNEALGSLDFTVFTYITLSLAVIFPISICFRVSLYFNLLKEYKLNSSNELV